MDQKDLDDGTSFVDFHLRQHLPEHYLIWCVVRQERSRFGRSCPCEREVNAAAVGVRVGEVRHHEHVTRQRAADALVQRPEAGPRRGDLERVTERAHPERTTATATALVRSGLLLWSKA